MVVQDEGLLATSPTALLMSQQISLIQVSMRGWPAGCLLSPVLPASACAAPPALLPLEVSAQPSYSPPVLHADDAAVGAAGAGAGGATAGLSCCPAGWLAALRGFSTEQPKFAPINCTVCLTPSPC